MYVQHMFSTNLYCQRFQLCQFSFPLSKYINNILAPPPLAHTHSARSADVYYSCIFAVLRMRSTYSTPAMKVNTRTGVVDHPSLKE